MRLDRRLIALGIAVLVAANINAATVCIQNKSTGLFEAKTPNKDGADACAAMNKDRETLPAVVLPVHSPKLSEVETKPASSPSTETSADKVPKSVAGPAPSAPVPQPALAIEPVSKYAELAALFKRPPKGHQWRLMPKHRSLKELVEDWCVAIDCEVSFETRDFPIDVKKERVISAGNIFDALELMGEAYRDSDAPFQVQPSTFNQIIILPMGQAIPQAEDSQ
ncbi:MAG TPA: hypothetical protein VEC35_09505 [Noviherbaspirillum sp.]|nr:hypothetical protein [Noviherbaspirillum sp.]